jgi:membrane associated rhomboid family serine protease
MYYQRSSFGVGGGVLPPGIKNLLYANGIVFIMQFINPSLNMTLLNNFALNPFDVIYRFKIWQLVTYMFLHGGFWHIFFNMFILWMFGAELEREWGTREFLKYYFIGGIGAGLTVVLFSNASTIGASGAVYAVMLAYALRYPDRMLYIYFLFPVKVKYFMGFMVLLSFFSTIGPNTDGIAHAAHLGGIAVGYLYLRHGLVLYKLRQMLSGLSSSTGKRAKSPGMKNMKYRPGGAGKAEYYRKAIDEILDKINRVGYLNLTDEEKKILEEGSAYLREHDEN